MKAIFWFNLTAIVVCIISLILRYWLDLNPTWSDVIVSFLVGMVFVFVLEDIFVSKEETEG